MKLLKLFTVFVLLALYSCGSKTDDKGLIVEQYIPVSISKIEKGQGTKIVEASGLFSTDDETLLSFKNGGLIDRIYVEEGDFVKRGQLLAVLNMTELNAKAEQVKAGMAKAERDFNRAKKLYEDSVATLEQYQNAKTGLEVIQQDWNTIEFNLLHSQIRANVDGYILMKLQNEGQMVGPGMPVFRVNGAGKGNWVVKVGITDREWASIKVGDSCVIDIDAYPNEIPGKVVRKSEGLDPNSLTFTVHVQPISMNGLAIATGMFAKTKIFGETKDAWQIPYTALLDGDKGKGYVFVTDDDSTAQKIEVEVGEILKKSVLITSGLEGHKNIIISGSPYLTENSKIKIIE